MKSYYEISFLSHRMVPPRSIVNHRIQPLSMSTEPLLAASCSISPGRTRSLKICATPSRRSWTRNPTPSLREENDGVSGKSPGFDAWNMTTVDFLMIYSCLRRFRPVKMEIWWRFQGDFTWCDWFVLVKRHNNLQNDKFQKIQPK